MTIADGLMILAVFTGPIVAVRLTRYLDNKKEIRERKLKVFKTLMATRAYITSIDHVLTLNKIDLEFNNTKDRKEKDVIEAWKAYHDLLTSTSVTPEQWATKQVDLFVELLHNMAIVLDYDFDKTHIKNSSYSPMAHGDIENEQRNIRKGLIEILEGKKVLPMQIMNWPNES